MWSLCRVYMCLLPLWIWIEPSPACDTTDDISPCFCELIEAGTIYKKIKIDCSNNDMRSVPTYFPSKTSYMDFSNNRLMPDSLNGLCAYGLLENVSLANNRITKLVPNHMSSCYITGSLNMSGNILDSVSLATLNGLDSIRNIYGLESFDFNSLVFSKLSSLQLLSIILHQIDIPADLFQGLTLESLSIDIRSATEMPKCLFNPVSDSLRELTVSSVSLKKIDDDLIKKMVGLKSFGIFVSKVQNVPQCLFQSKSLLATLESIVISGARNLPRKIFANLNSLTTLKIEHAEDMPSDLFEGLLSLKKLDLSHCSITQVSNAWFNDLLSLNTLILSQTGLQTIVGKAFTHLESLTELDMTRNSLRELNQSLFQEISDTVEILRLSNNILKIIDNGIFQNATSLKLLDLSENEIFSIKGAAFVDLIHLRELYLQQNKLFRLHPDTFRTNTNLEKIDLSSNVLGDTPDDFFSQTQKMRVINLSNNRMGSLGLMIISQIPGLVELNLEYNPIVCNCEPEVRNIIRNINITGTCDTPKGTVSILEFIREFDCPVSTTVLSFDSSGIEYVVSSALPSLPTPTETGYSIYTVAEDSNTELLSSRNAIKMSKSVLTMVDRMLTETVYSEYTESEKGLQSGYHFFSSSSNTIILSTSTPSTTPLTNKRTFDGIETSAIWDQFESSTTLVDRILTETVYSEYTESEEGLQSGYHFFSSSSSTIILSRSTLSSTPLTTNPTFDGIETSAIWDQSESMFIELHSSHVMDPSSMTSVDINPANVAQVTTMVTPAYFSKSVYASVSSNEPDDILLHGALPTQSVSNSVKPNVAFNPPKVSSTPAFDKEEDETNVVTPAYTSNSMYAKFSSNDSENVPLQSAMPTQSAAKSVSPNVTFNPPKVSFTPASAKEEEEEKEEDIQAYVYAVPVLCTAALICALVIGYFVFRRSRGAIYHVTRTTGADVDVDIDGAINGYERNERSPISLKCKVKNIPSIQTEAEGEDSFT